ncbi:nitrogen metabolic regulatory protein [Fusarium denticulatum]|uniref:Nitrogen metabolic regulatory protein n=1 Tax=Fusarium denticulatum TaxID=48507 RepID=A0A8H6CWS4_9HYPO|nr:nitrogen metabolic regulatory protein [Fusarium denticulatum]
MKSVLIVGATGAQGGAILRHLSSTGQYNITAFTRSATSPKAVELAALPNVKIAVSDAATGYDTKAFLAAASDVDYVLVNTDGFALGEQAETYWGIRLFELSARAGVKHFIYSGLDSVGHYQGKARIQDWIHAQKDVKMQWTIIRSGPYVELLSAVMSPAIEQDGSLTFQLPLDNGSIPFIHLGDFGKYVDWAFQHPEESKHLDFGIATVLATGEDIAKASENVSGKISRFVNVPIDIWNSVAWKSLPQGPDTKIGFQSVKDDSGLLMTYGENFKNWWNLYKASPSDNSGLIQRDFEFLDRIVPDRVKSVEEWMKKVQYTGDKQDLLNLEAHTK